jgi:hypothetical protein
MIITLTKLEDTLKLTRSEPHKKIYSSYDENNKKRKVYGDWMVGKVGQQIDIKEELKPAKAPYAEYWVAWPIDESQASTNQPEAKAESMPTPPPQQPPTNPTEPQDLRQESIVTQHSQEMALNFLDIFRNHVVDEEIEIQLKLVGILTAYFKAEALGQTEKKELTLAVLKTLTKVADEPKE